MQKRIQHYLEFELPQKHAEFHKGGGTRDHIANLRWIMVFRQSPCSFLQRFDFMQRSLLRM